jgi:membrane protease YdiL (CAAX protease family)
LQADTIGQLILNIGLMALLPAFAEELTFRGTLQQILKGEGVRVTGYRTHAAIWITAFVFSAIHMQFYGFIPRMLMGALFGYMLVWTGSLWIPVTMHFTNNALAVIAYYIEHSAFSIQHSDINIADTFGAGDTWYIGVISLLITCPGLLIFYRRTHKQ